MTTTAPAAGQAPRAKRSYQKTLMSQRSHLERYYADYTAAELAEQLGITAERVGRICRRYNIRKRAPNGTRWCRKQLPVAPPNATIVNTCTRAGEAAPIVNSNEIQCRAAA